MKIQAFFDHDTATISYVIGDETTGTCAIIDPVRNLDLSSGQLSTDSADRIIKYIQEMQYTVAWILETHVHADHLTAASYLKQKLGGRTGIGENIKKVLATWIPVFNTAADTPADGSQFDKLFHDGEKFKIGNLDVTVINTPGHTPDGVSYHINQAIFVGDTIFMPQIGTARTDFPGGSAKTLYQSIQKIYALPDDTRIYTCHDYPPAGQAPSWESTVDEQKKNNILIHRQVTEEKFIADRNQRDCNKPVPKLLYPSIQTNLRAGNPGKPENNGVSYLKIPLKQADQAHSKT